MLVDDLPAANDMFRRTGERIERRIVAHIHVACAPGRAMEISTGHHRDW